MRASVLACAFMVAGSFLSSHASSQEFGNQTENQFGNTSPTWFKRYGDDNWTAINAIELDGNSVITAGSLGQSRAISEFVGWARENIHIMRLDLGGGLIWGRRYTPKGVESPTEAVDLAVDSKGSIAVIADVEPKRENISGTTDESSVLIMKLGSSGEEIWQREYRKNREEKAKKVVAASDGSYMVLLQVMGDTKKTRLIKINRDGSYIGESMFPGHFFDISESASGFLMLGEDRAIQLDEAGKSVSEWEMVATASEFVGNEKVLYQRSFKIRGNRYMPTLTLANFDGSMVWQKRFDFRGKRLSYFRSMAAVSGGFILSGSYRDDFGVDSEVFIMMISEQGAPIWIKELTGSKAGTLANDILIHPQGGFFVAGAIDWDIVMSDRQEVLGTQAEAYVMRVSLSGENEHLVDVRAPRVQSLEQ